MPGEINVRPPVGCRLIAPVSETIEPFLTLHGLRRARPEQLMTDFPYRYDVTHSTAEIVEVHSALEAGAETEVVVTTPGGLLRRDQGKLLSAHPGLDWSDPAVRHGEVHPRLRGLHRPRSVTGSPSPVW